MTNTASAAGKRGSHRKHANSNAKLPSPTASVAPWMKGSLKNLKQSRYDAEAFDQRPNNFPICPRKMLMAMPLRNPTKMGLDRKSASAPRRK